MDKFDPKIWSSTNWLNLAQRRIVTCSQRFSHIFVQFFSFTFLGLNVVPNSDFLQIDWRLWQGHIVIWWLWFWHILFQNLGKIWSQNMLFSKLRARAESRKGCIFVPLTEHILKNSLEFSPEICTMLTKLHCKTFWQPQFWNLKYLPLTIVLFFLKNFLLLFLLTLL